MAASENQDFGGSEIDATSAEDRFQSARRKVMIAGAVLVPTIVTLHATPAWAQNPYTMTAYKYGRNQGLCRNPDWVQGDPPEDEFIQCQKGVEHDDPGGPPQGSGPDVF